MVVLKKNEKLKNCANFKKFNAATKKDLYPLFFTNEVINTIVGHEVYTFMGRFSRYHQISIAPIRGLTQNHLSDKLGGFCVGCDVIWCQK
jgi:hypothetical protein